MYRKVLLFAVLLIALLATIESIEPRLTKTVLGVASAQKPGSPISVTTTIYDFDTSGAQLLLRSDDYNGTGQATYTTVSSRKNVFVSSTISPDGQWLLGFSDQSGRRLWVTPNQGIDGSQPSGPPAGYYDIQKVYSVCRDANENVVPFPNLVQGSGNCSLAVNFNYGTTLYKLLTRPGALEGTQCPTGGCPATGLTKVTCNGVSSNKCVRWTITPNVDAPLAGVANLYSYTGPRGSEWVFIGQYYNTFRIKVTNP